MHDRFKRPIGSEGLLTWADPAVPFAVLLIIAMFVAAGCFRSDRKKDTVVVVTTNYVNGKPVVVTNTVPADQVEREAAQEEDKSPVVLYAMKGRLAPGSEFQTPNRAAPGKGQIVATVDWTLAGTLSAWLREGETLRRRAWHGEKPIVLSYATHEGANWNVVIQATEPTRYHIKITFVPD